MRLVKMEEIVRMTNVEAHTAATILKAKIAATTVAVAARTVAVDKMTNVAILCPFKPAIFFY